MTTTDRVMNYAKEYWPENGRIWVKVSAGPNPVGIGWTDRVPGVTATKSIQARSLTAISRFQSMDVGDDCELPVGYHPRHGVKTETWVRVR